MYIFFFPCHIIQCQKGYVGYDDGGKDEYAGCVYT